MRRQAVWLVYQEFQADTPDVVGLFEDRGEAQRAAEACRRRAREDYNWIVYGDRDKDGDPIAEWDVDVHVEAHEVHRARRPHRRRSPRTAA